MFSPKGKGGFSAFKDDGDVGDSEDKSPIKGKTNESKISKVTNRAKNRLQSTIDPLKKFKMKRFESITQLFLNDNLISFGKTNKKE